MVRNNVDYVPIDEAFGRIATTMFVVYPPGIATIVPGERLDERARPMLDYLKMFERSANLFPGFEAEIQGVYRETETDGCGALLYLRGAGVMPGASSFRAGGRPEPGIHGVCPNRDVDGNVLCHGLRRALTAHSAGSACRRPRRAARIARRERALHQDAVGPAAVLEADALE